MVDTMGDTMVDTMVGTMGDTMVDTMFDTMVDSMGDPVPVWPVAGCVAVMPARQQALPGPTSGPGMQL